MVSVTNKKGEVPRSAAQLNWGRNTVEECELIDMGFEGYPFTWSNERVGEENIQYRIDRSWAYSTFMDIFTPMRVRHLLRRTSDHAVLALELEARGQRSKMKKAFVFIFEYSWKKDNRCEEATRRAWNSTGEVEQKIRGLSSLGILFEKYCNNVIRKDIRKMEELIINLDLGASSAEDLEHMRYLNKRFQELLAIEEVVWRHRSREICLKCGDRNTKFFHGKASQRKSTNSI